MNKIVISASAKQQSKIKEFYDFFSSKGYHILNYPKPICKDKFLELYPDIHKQFLASISCCDILFIMNVDSNSTCGYIGAETFAELMFGVSQNLMYNKNIQIILYKMPEKSVSCYDEINIWLSLGWINLFDEKKLCSI